MYKYLKQLDFSGRVVNYMKGFTQDIIFELENKEGCEQLDRTQLPNKTTKEKSY